MALKKGICKNYDNCDLADNKEIQEVDSSEWKCQECGKDLYPVEGEKSSGSAGGGNKKLIIIIAAAVVLIGGIVVAVLTLGGKGGDGQVAEEPTTEQVEGVTPQKDNPGTTTPAETPVHKPAPATPKGGGASLNYGSYSGPTQGGKPHGVGGTVKVTRSYSLDLKDGKGSTLELHSGDVIANTKFENGTLRQGELQRTDGTRKWFSI